MCDLERCKRGGVVSGRRGRTPGGKGEAPPYLCFAFAAHAGLELEEVLQKAALSKLKAQAVERLEIAVVVRLDLIVARGGGWGGGAQGQ